MRIFLLALALALTSLGAAPARAAEPPRNQLPHQLKEAAPSEAVLAELTQLRRTIKTQQAQLDMLRDQVNALEQELGRARPNRKELVGSWRVVSVEEEGEPRPKAVARVVFGVHSLTFHDPEPGRTRAFSYKLDPAGEPREIDVFGGGARPTSGIYELKGEHLTLCIDRQLAARPTEFASRPGSGTTLWTLEREGAAAGAVTSSHPASSAP